MQCCGRERVLLHRRHKALQHGKHGSDAARQRRKCDFWPFLCLDVFRGIIEVRAVLLVDANGLVIYSVVRSIKRITVVSKAYNHFHNRVRSVEFV